MESASRQKPRRRTQAERRATTRTALLDATIDCLVEYGYAGTTTMRIVERAGVSRGAQVHHYPTKAELVAEAVRHLAAKRADEFVDEVSALPASGRKRIESLLDRLWAIHTSPLFAASAELIIASRTDPELGDRMVEVEREVSQRINSNLVGLFPDLAGNRRFRDSVDATLAAMRGVGMLSFFDSAAEVSRRWKALRPQLIALVADAVGT